jgi:hypothetical protein
MSEEMKSKVIPFIGGILFAVCVMAMVLLFISSTESYEHPYEVLTAIHRGQFHSRKAHVEDRDQDGIAEYLYLQELAGIDTRHNQENPGGSYTSSPYVARRYGQSWGKKYITCQDYHIVLYLPKDRKSAEREYKGKFPENIDEATDLREKHYAVYIWPTSKKSKIKKTYFINEMGIVCESSWAGCVGEDSAPDWNSALVYEEWGSEISWSPCYFEK